MAFVYVIIRARMARQEIPKQIFAYIGRKL